jgi:hypothetical protein
MSDLDGLPGFEVFHIRGNPTPEEAPALLEALEAFLARQKAGTMAHGATTTGWKLAGRLAARRGGILDTRTALGGGSWPASARLAWRGRLYEGRTGRGDSR